MGTGPSHPASDQRRLSLAVAPPPGVAKNGALMTNDQEAGSHNVKTRVVCVLIVVTGVVLHIASGHYAFHPKLRLATLVNFIFIIYMMLVPITLLFLRGARLWRLVVFGIWMAYIGLYVYTYFTMD